MSHRAQGYQRILEEDADIKSWAEKVIDRMEAEGKLSGPIHCYTASSSFSTAKAPPTACFPNSGNNVSEPSPTEKTSNNKWPESEFEEVDVPVPGGGSTKMKLATRQTTLSSGKASIPVTEVRRLTQTGHQTAIISTARSLSSPVLAGRMFSRWCQENFFGYMMEHYDIDGLVEYGGLELPGTTQVVNPAWRTLDKAIAALLAELTALNFEHPETGLEMIFELT